MKTVFLTITALTAFAFNSILCRLALGTNTIDAASFTTIRLVSGAIALVFIVLATGALKTDDNRRPGSWGSAFFLFAYAACFSFAYNGLSTATGALILFGSVQLTMFAVSIVSGTKPGLFEWLGLVAAFAGLVHLVLPGLEAPPVTASLLMAVAGAAWGFYTLRGKGSENPVGETCGNFVRSLPFVVLVTTVFVLNLKITWFGFGMAVVSGAVTSGIGYAVWYAALKYHTAARAAVMQLSVPLIAAVGGVLIVSETLSARLPVAAVLILGGILMTILIKRKPL